MAELVIVELNKAEVLAASKTIRRGEASVHDLFGDLWADHEGELECFLCAGVCAAVPFGMVLPNKHAARMVAVPLCESCRALPQMQRLGRCMKLLRKMWSKPKRH